MLLRLLSLAVITFALSACGGGGGYSSSPSPFNPNPNPFVGAQCDPGTAVQLANPQAGQTTSSNIGSVTIVASGNNNTLGATYTQWNVVLTDNFGNTINGGSLNLVAFPNGPHPYQSDFYYSSSMPPLPTGRQWAAGLVNDNSNCSPLFLGDFFT